MKDKVVYLHKKAGTDEVVYVGIGSPSRPFNFEGRSDFWKRVHAKYGIDVEVIHTGLTWQEACKIEIDLIAHYGRRDQGTGCLVNMTAGGEGANGYKFTEEQRKVCSDAAKNYLANNPHPQQGKPVEVEHGVRQLFGNLRSRVRRPSRKVVTSILRLYVKGHPECGLIGLSKRFKLSKHTVGSIVNGKSKLIPYYGIDYKKTIFKMNRK